MLVDANLLLYAADRRSPFHEPAAKWLESVLNGDRRVGLPWQSLGAFLRISTHPRVSDQPLTMEQAWQVVEEWLDLDITWTPSPTDRHAAVLGPLLRGRPIGGRLVSDALLAALALEHGLAVYSADSDFARFPEVRWVDPLRDGA
jgi:toxin-antitoxin system PIN domain toxin